MPAVQALQQHGDSTHVKSNRWGWTGDKPNLWSICTKTWLLPLLSLNYINHFFSYRYYILEIIGDEILFNLQRK